MQDGEVGSVDTGWEIWAATGRGGGGGGVGDGLTALQNLQMILK